LALLISPRSENQGDLSQRDTRTRLVLMLFVGNYGEGELQRLVSVFEML
jgi:hypothetical protein